MQVAPCFVCTVDAHKHMGGALVLIDSWWWYCSDHQTSETKAMMWMKTTQDLKHEKINFAHTHRAFW